MELLKKIPTAQALQLLRKYWQHIAVFIVTATGCWYFWGNPSPRPPELYKPEVKQADGSLILEKRPDATAKPPMSIPKGSVMERAIKITVKAKNPIQEIGGTVEVHETITTKAANSDMAANLKEDHFADAGKVIECPPVTLEMALVRLPDESRRVIAKSEDGLILSAVDIPIENALPTPQPLKNAIGVTGSTSEKLGVWYDRQIGWLVIGGQINNAKNGSFKFSDGYEGWGKIGLKF